MTRTDRARAARRCVSCPARTFDTRARCPECDVKMARSRRRWRATPFARLLDRIGAAIRRDTRMRAGICTRCSLPAAQGRKLCANHLLADKVRVASRSA